MKCKEHPRYTGARKPRTDCTSCHKIYKAQQSDKGETKGKEKEVVKEAPQASEPTLPDRLLCLNANQYRHEISKFCRRYFPNHLISCNFDGSTIMLQERKRAVHGLDDPPLTEVEFLEKSQVKEKKIKRGDIYFSDKLQVPVIIIGFNPKTKIVHVKEWYTQELLSLTKKDFDQLQLRDVITEEDLIRMNELIGKVKTI